MLRERLADRWSLTLRRQSSVLPQMREVLRKVREPALDIQRRR